MKKRIARHLTLITAVVVFAASTFTANFVCRRVVVEGASMETTYEDGDNLILDELSYRFTTPERFDVVVAKVNIDGEDTLIIKRVIGLSGETVRIIGGDVYIDGKKLAEDTYGEKIDDPGLAENEIKLGENEYFCMGDNRNDSLDSRSEEIGVIRKEQIQGKIFHARK